MNARAVLDQHISEKAFQETVLATARATGWRCYHVYDSRRSEPGFPDLICVRGERVIAAELKKMNGQVRPEQRVWLEALRATGKVEVFLWRPIDWDTIEEVLR